MLLDLSTIAVIFGIISTLIGGAVWVMSLVNKITTRVVTQEKDVATLKTTTTNLEKSINDYQIRIINVENNIANYSKDLTRLTESMNHLTEKLQKMADDLHKLINIVNNKTMEKQYAEEMMKKIDKIMDRVDEKE